jgi:hypothetical protein
MEHIDQAIIWTQAATQKELSEKYKKKREQYKQTVKTKVLLKALLTLKDLNPVRHAFKEWQNCICPIIRNRQEIEVSQEEKKELTIQCELLRTQNDKLAQDI